MKPVVLKCPKCGYTFDIKNKLAWIWQAPVHTFTKRYTKCPNCGKRSYMKREK